MEVAIPRLFEPELIVDQRLLSQLRTYRSSEETFWATGFNMSGEWGYPLCRVDLS